jgi:hypothetical protein
MPIDLKAIKITLGGYVIYPRSERLSLDAVKYENLRDLLMLNREGLEVALRNKVMLSRLRHNNRSFDPQACVVTRFLLSTATESSLSLNLSRHLGRWDIHNRFDWRIKVNIDVLCF